ncbi:hypothetical protein CAN33_0012015 [Aspergillus niger]|uniref:Uncharacterized protein n=1 Tax=Aspergillus niger TaxID=5061 RepID=A0A505HZJ9_ASPNG|nr:hypothetical protein CAN33_0012015 [Aspergillus niger]
MPPPSDQRHNVDPPEEITSEAVRGFMTGVFRQSPFSKEFLRSRLFYRPLEGFSEWLSPASKIYRGLTPQFKVFLQIGAMTLGGCIWAERRVDEYIKYVRKVKRLEKLQAERAARGLE